MIKKILFLILSYFIAVSVSVGGVCEVLADDGQGDSKEEESELELELSEEIKEQLDGLDLSGVESIFSSLGDDEYNLFKSSTFSGALGKILDGDFGDDKSFFSSVIEIVFDDVFDFVPLLSIIVSISVLCSFMSAIKSDNGGKSVADIIHFICYCVVITLVINAVMQAVELTTNTINSISSQMEAIFPIMLTLMVASGGSVSVGIFQPTIAVFCTGVSVIFKNFVMPLFIFSIVFAIISNLTDTVKLNKFSAFFSSLFKWVIGLIFTIFSAFMTVKGITAGSFDSVSFKTAKYTIKSAVPILGGYLSDGLNVIVASSVLIKNSVGLAGILLLFSTVIVPVIKLIVFMLVLKLIAAILEPIGDVRISGFVSSVSKYIPMLIAIILGMSFMYILSAGMLMTSANFA